MYRDQTFLAVIPARRGSKRLPRKNLLDLNGKPLVSWTIEACLNSDFIDQVCVTSDDNDVLSIAKTQLFLEFELIRYYHAKILFTNCIKVLSLNININCSSSRNYTCFVTCNFVFK